MSPSLEERVNSYPMPRLELNPTVDEAKAYHKVVKKFTRGGHSSLNKPQRNLNSVHVSGDIVRSIGSNSYCTSSPLHSYIKTRVCFETQVLHALKT
jgi:hypothetical protein